jgi:hypothetical protein
MRDTIEMAREAGYIRTVHGGAEVSMASMDCLKSFEALVRADERNASQAEHEADKTIIEYHEATIKRLEAEILAEREAFAKLADQLRAAVLAEREETNRRANASWTLMCEKMVAAEREACAKICEKEQEEWGWDSDVMDAATAIRARGAASIRGNITGEKT